MFEKLKAIFSRRPKATPQASAGYGRAGNYFDGSKYALGIAGSGRGLTLDPRTLRQNARAAYHETVSAHALVNRFGDTVGKHRPAA